MVGRERDRLARARAAAGELLGDVPSGLGDGVDEDDVEAGVEEVLDRPDIAGDDPGLAVGLVLRRRADRGEEIPGPALDAALAVVEALGGDPGDPAGGDDGDRDPVAPHIVLDTADELVARRRRGRAGAGEPGDRRAGAAGDGVEAEARGTRRLEEARPAGRRHGCRPRRPRRARCPRGGSPGRGGRGSPGRGRSCRCRATGWCR